jgi:hypothetical protein
MVFWSPGRPSVGAMLLTSLQSLLRNFQSGGQRLVSAGLETAAEGAWAPERALAARGAESARSRQIAIPTLRRRKGRNMDTPFREAAPARPAWVRGRLFPTEYGVP